MMQAGRIFFEPPYQPEKAIILTLKSHINNVTTLIRAWDDSRAYRAEEYSRLEQTRPKLITAAERHDEAKPSTFKLKKEAGRWGYSFSGHRFRVPCDDLYVDALIKMHHEFSVDGVAEWQARLRRELGDLHAQNFPFDLYTLEMCDQVAAETESYAFQDEADERAFMELHSRMRSDNSVEIEPYPFGPSPLPLTLSYAELVVTEDMRDEEKLRDIIVKWESPELKERMVMLCRP